MKNWQDYEVRALLTIRGKEEIKSQITGTVKDTVVYGVIRRLLGERDVHRSQNQIISKLKALRRQYTTIRDHHKNGGGGGGTTDHWPYYELCSTAFVKSGPAMNNSSVRRTSTRTRRTTKRTTTSPPPSPSFSPVCVKDEEQQEDTDEDNKPLAVNGTTEDTDEEDTRSPQILSVMSVPTTMERAIAAVSVKTGQQVTDEDEPYIDEGPDAVEDAPEQASMSQPSQSSVCNVRSRKQTKMDQAMSAFSTVMVDQLREMDSAMHAREDARLQRFMEHERELQSSLMTQLMAMQERIIQDNRESQMAVLDRLLSRLPAPAPAPDLQNNLMQNNLTQNSIMTQLNAMQERIIQDNRQSQLAVLDQLLSRLRPGPTP